MKKSLLVIVCIFSAVSLCASEERESPFSLPAQQIDNLSYWKNVEQLRTDRLKGCIESGNNPTLTIHYGLEVKIAQLQQQLILDPQNAQEYNSKITQYLQERYTNSRK